MVEQQWLDLLRFAKANELTPEELSELIGFTSAHIRKMCHRFGVSILTKQSTYSEQEKAAHVQSWKESKLSYLEYAAEKSISESAIRRWHREMLKPTKARQR